MEDAGSGGSSQSRGKADTSQGMDILEQEICWVEDLQLSISEQKPPTFAWMGSASAAKNDIPSTPRNASYQDTEYLISTGGLRRIRIHTPSAEKSSDRDVVRADLFGNQSKIDELVLEIQNLREINSNLLQENLELKQDTENFAELFKNYLEGLLAEAEKKHQVQINALKTSYEAELDDLRAENTEFVKRIRSLELLLSQTQSFPKSLLSIPRDVEPEIIVSPRPDNQAEEEAAGAAKEQEEFYFSGPVEDFHLLLHQDDKASATDAIACDQLEHQNLPSTSESNMSPAPGVLIQDSGSVLGKGLNTNNLLGKILASRSGKFKTLVRDQSPAKLNHTNKSTRAISTKQQQISELSRFEDSVTSGFPLSKPFLKSKTGQYNHAGLYEHQTKSPQPSKSKIQPPQKSISILQTSTYDQRSSKRETSNPKRLRSQSRPKSPLTVHRLLHKTAAVDTTGWPLRLLGATPSTIKKPRRTTKHLTKHTD